jgi:hypothetical protein
MTRAQSLLLLLLGRLLLRHPKSHLLGTAGMSAPPGRAYFFFFLAAFFFAMEFVTPFPAAPQ